MRESIECVTVELPAPFKKAVRLRLTKKALDPTMRQQFKRWLITSILTYGLSIGLTTALVEMGGLNPQLAFFITLIVAIFAGFLLCTYWVYETEGENWVKLLLKYISSVSLFRIADYIIYSVLLKFTSLYYPIIIMIVLPITSIMKFYSLNVFVFNKKQNR